MSEARRRDILKLVRSSKNIFRLKRQIICIGANSYTNEDNFLISRAKISQNSLKICIFNLYLLSVLFLFGGAFSFEEKIMWGVELPEGLRGAVELPEGLRGVVELPEGLRSR